MGPTQAPVQFVPIYISGGKKGEVWIYSHTPSAEFMNEWIYGLLLLLQYALTA